MPEHTEEDFEEHVSEASRLFLEKTVKGFYLCENGLEPPQIPFPEYRFQGLPALDKLLMEWGRNETCAKNEGYSGWHAKYMAACCYLSQGYKESNTQTTIRTTRCAVIMINQVLSSVREVWGDNAFSIWPALAMKGYLLASVGRHAEPVRRAIVVRVSKTLLSEHEKPKLVEYNFNPVRLMSTLIGASEQSIAGKLKLPYLPDRKGWTWADLGLHGVHDFVARSATPLSRMPSYRSLASSKPLQTGRGTLPSSSSAIVQPGVVSPYNDDFSNLHYQSFSASAQYPPITCAPLLQSQLISGSRYPCQCEAPPFHKIEGKSATGQASEDRDTTRYNKGSRTQGCTGSCNRKPYYGQPPADNALSAEWMGHYSNPSLKESCGLPSMNDGGDFMHQWPDYYHSPAPDHIIPTMSEGYSHLHNADQNFRR